MMFIIHSKKYGDKEVLIDDEDYEKIKKYNWFVWYHHNNYYLAANKKIKHKRTIILMHRLLSEDKRKMENIDHINGNGLDNRKCNLRGCSIKENSKNRKRSKCNTSGFKGVTLYKRSMKWRALITVDYKDVYLGMFNTPESAYAAYCEAAKKYHGEFARFN